MAQYVVFDISLNACAAIDKNGCYGVEKCAVIQKDLTTSTIAGVKTPRGGVALCCAAGFPVRCRKHRDGRRS